MNGAIGWFARNPVASNLLMALLLAGGLLTLPTIEQAVFPEISLDVVNVSVLYPGASPAEVEESICMRIEQELQGLAGVKRLHATASEGHGEVTVELLLGEDLQRRMDDIRTRVDRIDSFPDESEDPVVTAIDLRFQVINVSISGAVDEWTLKRLGERTRDDIAALPGITDVELVATRDYEIAIEVSEDALARHGITFDEVVGAVERSSLDLPGGSIKTEGGEILLRTVGQAYRATDFEKLPLISRLDGTRLTIGDVGRINDGFEESDRLVLFDGSPSAVVEVYRVGKQSALDISETVRDYVDTASRALPENVSMTVWQDDSRFLRDRLGTLLRNARGGFLLVVGVLALFLRLRLALWVSLGIPISFLGALWLLPSFDISIDLISLTAFIVVLGIVVDDAIIVGENVHTEQVRSGDLMLGAIRGTHAIATPVVFGVLTTIAAFAPMLNVPGPIGNVARIIPIIVILCLVFSLLESLFVLPAHLGHGQGTLEHEPRHRISRWWRDFQDGIAGRLDHFIEHRYTPALQWALEWRYLCAATAIAALLITLGMLGGGWLRFVFQPDVEGDTMVAFLAMPQGSTVESTAEAVAHLERAAQDVRERIAADGGAPQIFSHVQMTVGQQPFRLRQASGPAAFADARSVGSHLGEVMIEVVPAKERDISVTELTRLWRERAGEISGAIEVTFSASIMSAGAPVHIDLAGRDLEELRAAAEMLEARLAAYPGVIDVRDSFLAGKQELELEIRPSAEALGLSLSDLARQVRQAFYGHEVQRIQRGRDDVRVVVRYPADERHSLGDLEKMRIRTADGSAVPFASVARARLGTGFSRIQRVDARRIVTVTSDVDKSRANANEVLADVRREIVPELMELYPGVSLDFGGEQREQADFLGSLARGWLIALLAIFALLAIPLRSYVQPLIIMSAIPFGLVGAAWGHILLGHDFSMFSVIGVVALSGVVVNDSLVLVDFVNRRRAVGLSLDAAIREAGPARFRAILLTSLTTFAGLTPLMLETSPQAMLLIPMGISLAFGVLFATVITLLLVPVAYAILEDLVGSRVGESVPNAEPAPAHS